MFVGVLKSVELGRICLKMQDYGIRYVLTRI